MEDALTFCGNLGETHLYFIVDQINALEQEETNADSVSNHEKDDLRKFLRSITFGHYSITSASANYQTFQRMAQKQTGEIKMSMMGGMSKVRNPPLDAMSPDFNCFCFAGGDETMVGSPRG